MRKRLSHFFAVIGFVVVMYALVILVVVLVSKGHVPKKTVVELNLEQPLIEAVPDDPLAQAMNRDNTTVRDIVETLERAEKDDRVVGVVARIGATRMGLAQAQEIRNAVLHFRQTKKFAIAFAETFGEFRNGGGSYYVATGFEQIWLQPSGDIGLTGIMLESPFIKGTLAKLGLSLHGDHRYEYKNAFNFYTETKYTPAHREAMQKILDSWFGQMLKGIGEARHKSPDEVKALIDKGPFLGKEALDAGLVDKLGYRDEAYDEVKKLAGSDAELLYSEKYLKRAGRPHDKGKKIALIYGVGTVVRGKSGFDPIQGDFYMGSDTVAAAFREAAEDKDVKAILFRVDSPGGSYVASDTIWREAAKAKKAGKPIIVSMGDLAGSGGYFVAMNADKIVAQPGTITASIGVLGGKVLTSGFWDKIGLTWDEIHTSQNSTMWTGTHDYSPAEWARLQQWLDRVYVDFTGKVADGRKLPKDNVLQIAKGRIWSGEDGKALGLVDELGGFPEALALAKKAAAIPDSEEVKLAVYPTPKSMLQQLLKKGAENSERDAAVEAMVGMLRTIQPAMRQLHAITANPADDVLKTPEFEVTR
ncbi:MAG: S49 family peptidase [Acidobacteriia bacterium]|nr:S49 family peptidase [Terriglobia bacterium]